MTSDRDKNFYQTNPFKTREVMVGNVGVGGTNPVRIQSMTTSDTRDVEATVEQIARLKEVGCEIVRITVQGMTEARACEAIKNTLVQRGIDIPLVADIHFYPKAALSVVDVVDKVRINPGNFVDKRAQFKTLEFTEASYALALKKIEDKFAPLVEKCKKLKKVLRIGTNHGSLSDRIMSWYGDTPRGMVESALEFAQVARACDFHDIIFSMKSSNPQVMIESYRLLVKKMEALGWNYPLHLGVTEAGEGEDGRVKSAIGIGALLLDGLGDTLRISLTEDPWNEIDPCRQLIVFSKNRGNAQRVILKAPRREVKIPSKAPLHPDGTFLLPGDEASLKAPMVTEDPSDWSKLRLNPPPCVLFAPTTNRVTHTRLFIDFLRENRLPLPVILTFSYVCPPDELAIEASAELGSLLCDGYGEGIAIGGDYPHALLKSLSLSILQGARMRLSKTEFISCPGCGRTLFNLQEVAAKIRKKTAHLPGVKIAIMGCIVNGPGEMADADFGFVGSRPGKIDLFIGKSCVEKNIEMDDAPDRLIELIKSQDRWQDP